MRIALVLLTFVGIVIGRETVALKCIGGDSTVVEGKILKQLLEIGEENDIDIVERQQMNVILGEQTFQQTGCTDVSCAVEIGKILNVQKMLLYASSYDGGFYYINLRLVEVKTSKVLATNDAGWLSWDQKGMNDLHDRIASLFIKKKLLTQYRTVETPQKREALKPMGTLGAPNPQGATIFISSIPPVAAVYMDGKFVGKTNLEELKVQSGTHEMKFVKSGKELTTTMNFYLGKNASQMIRIPSEQWEALQPTETSWTPRSEQWETPTTKISVAPHSRVETWEERESKIGRVLGWLGVSLGLVLGGVVVSAAASSAVE